MILDRVVTNLSREDVEKKRPRIIYYYEDGIRVFDHRCQLCIHGDCAKCWRCKQHCKCKP